MPTLPRRPSPAERAAAAGRTVPDLVRPGLDVVLCGINPSLDSAVLGHHFGNAANRLWPVLHLAGFTPRRLVPTESPLLLDLGIGVTNLVPRASATAAEVSPEEVRAGGLVLAERLAQWQPRWVAFLGLTAYRVAFGRPDAVVGPQAETVGGVRAWLLPNPSGLNAHYQLADLVELYGALRTAIESDRT